MSDRRGPRPRGESYPAPEWWQDAVRLAMRQATPRMTEDALAKKVGCAKGTAISNLLRRGRASKLVPLISKVLGIPTPVHWHGRDIAEIVQLLATADPEARAAVRLFLEAWLAGRPRSEPVDPKRRRPTS